MLVTIKGAWSDFWKFVFLVSHVRSSRRRFQFKISVESVHPFWFYEFFFCILHLPILHCGNIDMVTITTHIFTYIFQTECVSVIIFLHGLWEIMNEKYFGTKISKTLKKKLTQLGQTPLSIIYIVAELGAGIAFTIRFRWLRGRAHCGSSVLDTHKTKMIHTAVRK